jgi:hypothetical protein
VNRSTGAGLAVTAAPAAHVADRDDEVLLRYLAGNLYAGHGAHGLFMKTWAAGLAYSNGVRPRPAEGRLYYYAERSPRLPDTLRFVGDQLGDAEVTPAILEYAVAQAFTSRGADPYEERAAAHAADLADGVQPETVRGFRERILALRRRPDLRAAVEQRVEAVHGALLPGYGPASLRRPEVVYFFSGPEAQLAALEAWLREREGPETRVERIYPRDFWLD